MEKNLEFYFVKLQQDKTQRSFEQIYKLTSLRLFGVIIRILKRKELSEDCLQEVYIKIWNRLDSYNAEKANMMTWMSTIARNHAIDYVRKHELPIQDDFELSIIKDEQIHFLNSLEANDASKQLHDCLKQLKAESRTVVFMAYFNGLTYDNIAKAVGSPVNTVKTWVSRSLPILRKCLEGDHA
ncbi:MAG: sigma-70 family RNA polymerase sigma factor [Candidatus Thioglobus sp.]|uniref:sigma-70 family RNA polymerase sigma factor n=1 Tax=Candidatus Thioglobus sp. TaxID=2026721 RepID=UPI002618792A|nr:sigma-70 family RNA polymerase sigma factor [Candidatus Thioglobus sp.]MDC9727521.1 sigma-70 family RNA polymerase sigma factor [Candidatus Thioglobus sp.]